MRTLCLYELLNQKIKQKMVFTRLRYYEVGRNFSKVLVFRLRKQQADSLVF